MSSDRPVCYPANDEIETIPAVMGYPKYPERVQKSIWQPNNRIGDIFIIKIGYSIKTSFVLTRMMTNECEICLYKAKSLIFKLTYSAFLIASPLYYENS